MLQKLHNILDDRLIFLIILSLVSVAVGSPYLIHSSYGQAENTLTTPSESEQLASESIVNPLICDDGTTADESNVCADGSIPQSATSTANSDPMNITDGQLVCSDGTAPDAATGVCADGSQPQPQSQLEAINPTEGTASITEQLICSDGTAPEAATGVCADGSQPQPMSMNTTTTGVPAAEQIPPDTTNTVSTTPPADEIQMDTNNDGIVDEADNPNPNPKPSDTSNTGSGLGSGTGATNTGSGTELSGSQVNACNPASATLAIKAKGPQVTNLQQILIGLGYTVGPKGADGDFGKNTQAAVTKFQQDKSLDPTGEVNSATWTALCSATPSSSTGDKSSDEPTSIFQSYSRWRGIFSRHRR